MIRSVAIAISVAVLGLSSVSNAQAQEATSAQTQKELYGSKKFSSLEEEKAFLEQSINSIEDDIEHNPKEVTEKDRKTLEARKKRLNVIDDELDKKKTRNDDEK